MVKKSTKQKKFKVVSLFTGAGGLDLGLKGGFTSVGESYEHNPFDIIWANELNRKACDTLELNFPDTQVVCGDISKIAKVNQEQEQNVELFEHNVEIPSADVVVGGFPCQDFSLAGKRQGLTVQRGQLYLSMAKVIENVKPKVFLAENVKGLLSWEGGLGIKTMVEDFAKIGYKVSYRLLNTADYGVPQKRERVIILGVREDIDADIVWPEPTHSSDPESTGLKPWVTLKDAIGDLEDDKVHFCLPNSGYSKAKLFPGRQGNTKTKADYPGPTMRAEHHGNIEFHYGLDRRLSAREAARIQSFPDDFVFLRSTSDAYRQVGNAVAPVFGWHLAKALQKMLDS